MKFEKRIYLVGILLGRYSICDLQTCHKKSGRRWKGGWCGGGESGRHYGEWIFWYVQLVFLWEIEAIMAGKIYYGIAAKFAGNSKIGENWELGNLWEIGDQ